MIPAETQTAPFNSIIVGGGYIPPSHQLKPGPMEFRKLLAASNIMQGWKEVKTFHNRIEPAFPKGHWLGSYFSGTPKSGYWLNPPWLRQLNPRRLPSCPALHNNPPFKTADNIAADIRKAFDKLYGEQDDRRERINKYIHTRTGDYFCVATDGCRALLQKEVKTGRRRHDPWPVCGVPDKSGPRLKISEPEIINGLRRLAVLVRENKECYVRFTWTLDTLTLTSKEDGNGDEGIEEYPCESNIEGSFCMNPYFLLSMQTWPINCYFKSHKDPVVFMPSTLAREFMYVVMPMVP